MKKEKKRKIRCIGSYSLILFKKIMPSITSNTLDLNRLSLKLPMIALQQTQVLLKKLKKMGGIKLTQTN